MDPNRLTDKTQDAIRHAQSLAQRLGHPQLLVARMGRGPLGARRVSDTVEAAIRAAGRVVRESNASDDLVEIVCRAALEAVRGHGGATSQWLAEATGAAQAVLDELAVAPAEEYKDRAYKDPP